MGQLKLYNSMLKRYEMFQTGEEVQVCPTNMPHEAEVARWLDICMKGALGVDIAGKFSAVTALLMTAWQTNDIVGKFASQEEHEAFLYDTIEANCAFTIAVFHEAYPNGYTKVSTDT